MLKGKPSAIQHNSFPNGFLLLEIFIISLKYAIVLHSQG